MSDRLLTSCPLCLHYAGNQIELIKEEMRRQRVNCLRGEDSHKENLCPEFATRDTELLDMVGTCFERRDAT